MKWLTEPIRRLSDKYFRYNQAIDAAIELAERYGRFEYTGRMSEPQEGDTVLLFLDTKERTVRALPLPREMLRAGDRDRVEQFADFYLFMLPDIVEEWAELLWKN